MDFQEIRVTTCSEKRDDNSIIKMSENMAKNLHKTKVGFMSSNKTDHRAQVKSHMGVHMKNGWTRLRKKNVCHQYLFLVLIMVQS